MKENNHQFIENFIEEPIILEPEDWGIDQWRTFLDVFGLESADRIVLERAWLKAYGKEKSEEDLREGRRNPLDKEIRREIFIKVQSRDEEVRLTNKIHRQLCENEDYLTGKIVLDESTVRNDGTKNEIHLTIFSNSESDPEVLI